MLKVILCCQVRETTLKPDTGLNRNAQKAFYPEKCLQTEARKERRARGCYTNVTGP